MEREAYKMWDSSMPECEMWEKEEEIGTCASIARYHASEITKRYVEGRKAWLKIARGLP